MTFNTKTDLLNYINAHIATNGANSITGQLLNDCLVGVLQFLMTENDVTFTIGSGKQKPAGNTITDTIFTKRTVRWIEVNGTFSNNFSQNLSTGVIDITALGGVYDGYVYFFFTQN